MRISTLAFPALLVIGLGMDVVHAQEQPGDTLSTEAKIDSVYQLQKQIYREIRNEPLAGKRFGVEFNFIRALVIEEDVTLSGGFSLFDVDRNAEIAFPFYYANPGDAQSMHEITLDCHYRYFLGNTRNGFYLSGFTRFAHLEGYEEQSQAPFWDVPELAEIRTTRNKIGIGVGLGYRKFSYKGLYWGCSFSFGRYLTGRNDIFYSNWDDFASLNNDDGKYIFDIEFLKFGWAF
ncbi:MAG TPA: hypothetical protein PKJ13_00650 [bacterium]|nr:hypothetical protein [bacterium]HOY44140.1 hypothetical protein [bacterium]HPG82184.1 hypothetical protein [bacterium]HPM59237.1 hypothetical protein [bacterium]